MSGKPGVESVLCFSRKAIPEHWMGIASAVRMDEKAFFSHLAERHARYIPREHAETDISFKQLIPYIVLQSPDRGLIATYRRCGAEKRLHDFWSIGIGGHVNRDDTEDNSFSLKSSVEAGVRRELAEELKGIPSGITPAFTGVINEEITDVGAVHIGMVYCLMITDTERLKASDELSDFEWIEPARLSERPLEIWSKLALILTEGTD